MDAKRQHDGRVVYKDEAGTHLRNPEANKLWMESTYSTESYWSDDLAYGYRWSKDSPIKDYRQAAVLVDRWLKPFLPGNVGSCLEIGPGGGRWTTELLRIARKLHLSDISESSINVCRERFKYYENLEYHVGDGSDLSFVKDGELDLIFSWGVFVHIQKAVIENYVKQFSRILSPQGVAFVQHGAWGVNVKQVRTDFTNDDMEELADKHGLTVWARINTSEGVFPEHKDGKEVIYLDTISVLQKKRYPK
jgi:ubiquinone/menaquinone biosynthesis C-methylase UbiE